MPVFGADINEFLNAWVTSNAQDSNSAAVSDDATALIIKHTEQVLAPLIERRRYIASIPQQLESETAKNNELTKQEQELETKIQEVGPKRIDEGKRIAQLITKYEEAQKFLKAKAWYDLGEGSNYSLSEGLKILEGNSRYRSNRIRGNVWYNPAKYIPGGLESQIATSKATLEEIASLLTRPGFHSFKQVVKDFNSSEKPEKSWIVLYATEDPYDLQRKLDNVKSDIEHSTKEISRLNGWLNEKVSIPLAKVFEGQLDEYHLQLVSLVTE